MTTIFHRRLFLMGRGREGDWRGGKKKNRVVRGREGANQRVIEEAFLG